MQFPFLSGLFGGMYRTPGINPNAPTPGMPPSTAPTGFADRLNSPMAQIGLQILANSGRGVRLGEAAGRGVLGYQDQQRQSMEDELKKRYMEAQIKAMGTPSPTAQRAPVIVRGPDGKPVYADPSAAIGQQPYMEPRGSAQGPGELEIAQALNDPDVPEAVKKDLRALIDRKYREPQSTEPLIAIQTPDGRTILAPRSQASGATPAATRENPSGEERAAANYYGRMEAAEKLLGGYKPTLMESIAAEKWMEGGSATSAVANSMLGEKGGSFYQAAADWVRAKLRKESGAVISPEEMVQEIRTYFPQPGDSPSRIEQKRKARLQAMSGMKDMSGRASPREVPAASPDDPLGIR